MTSLSVLSLPYLPRLDPYYESVAHLPWSVWLSSQGGGRYDIIAAAPRVRCVTHGRVTQIETDNLTWSSTDDPLSIVKRLIKSRPSTSPVLPFNGGAIGYLSYDLGHRFLDLPTHAHESADWPLMMMGIYDWALIADHQRQRLWWVGLLEHRHWYEQFQRVQAGNDWSTGVEAFELCSDIIHHMSRDQYNKAFAAIKQGIIRGDCYQVNLAQRFSACYAGDPLSLFYRLRDDNPMPFSVFARYPDHHIISCSPERLLSRRGSRLVVQPIKGTAKREVDDDMDVSNALRCCPKNRAENLMIVDLMRNDLAKSSVPGSVRVTSLCALERYPGVYHLVSTITSICQPGRHAVDALRDVFPSGSITGAPKHAVATMIQHHEPHQRHVYCGSMVYISADGQMDSSVAIRTLLLRSDELYFWSGGGLVYDSDVDVEYAECLTKVAKIKQVLLSSRTNHE